MARIYSSSNGVKRGRVGSSVFRKGQNAVVESQYQPQVANPRSLAQAVQRAAFGTAVQAQSALSSIVNHSHRGVAGKRANLQRFVNQNAALIRSAILREIDGGMGYEGSLNIRNVRGIQPAPYLVSEGSLPMQPTFLPASGGEKAAILLLDDIDSTINSQAEYERQLSCIGLVPGDQISLIAIVTSNLPSGSFNSSEEGTVQNIFCHVLASRVTFVTNIPANFSGNLVADGAFNPSLVAKSEGNMLVSTDGTNDLRLSDGRMDADEIMAAAAIVRSQLDINGKYDYSTTQMAVKGEYPALLAVVESYTNVASARFGNQPFLDNANAQLQQTMPNRINRNAASTIPQMFEADTESAMAVDNLTAAPTNIKACFATEGGFLTPDVNLAQLAANDFIIGNAENGIKATDAPTFDSDTEEWSVEVAVIGSNYTLIGLAGECADGSTFEIGYGF